MKKLIMGTLTIMAVAACIFAWQYTHPQGVNEAAVVVFAKGQQQFATLRFFPNNAHTKAYMKVDMMGTVRGDQQPFIVKQIDVWMDLVNEETLGGERKGFGYLPVDVKDLYDGGVAVVIDEDLFYGVRRATSMQVVLTSVEGDKLVYEPDPRKLDLQSVRFLERAVQGERRS